MVICAATGGGSQWNGERLQQKPGLLTLRVVAMRYLAQGTHLYELRDMEDGVLPSAEAGAHIDLHLPNGLVRQYSLVIGEPGSRSYFIAVKQDTEGRGGSHWLHNNLRLEMLLEVGLPRNNFPLVSDAEQSVLIAGGIGITPILSMVRELRERGSVWELHYSCRSRSEMAFLEMLPKVPQVHLHLDDENDGAFLDLGRIVSAAPPAAHLYCCGPLPMLQAFEAASAGRMRERVHVEYFKAPEPTAATRSFIVELARSGRTVVVPCGQSILETLLDAGVNVPYSCSEGICGACETVVLDGTPEHRDHILSEAERATGRTMMICCSGSKTDSLILDL